MTQTRADREAATQAASAPEAGIAEADLHEANEWGIEVVPDESAGPAAFTAAAALPQGLEYSMPVSAPLWFPFTECAVAVPTGVVQSV